MRTFLVLVCCSIWSLGAFAQNSELGNWLIYIGNKKIVPRWSWHHELQYRNYNFITDLEQLLIRTGIGYDLDAEGRTNALLGYAFIHTQPYLDNGEKKQVNEHRLFQQLILKQSWGRLSLQHRYRTEQRWIEENFRFRLRYFLSANLALSRPQMGADTWYLSAYNEIFIHTDAVPFDRNRLYGGIGYQITKGMRLELGYMNQFLASGGRDQINFFVFLNF